MLNRVIIEGNLTDNIDLRKTQNGKMYVQFSIANNEGSGENKKTEFVNVVAWEKTAELVSRFCQKGTRVIVEGRFKTDTYEKDGKKVYKSYVLASNIEFLSKTVEISQPKLSDNSGRDMFGGKVEIEPGELPFY